MCGKTPVLLCVGTDASPSLVFRKCSLIIKRFLFEAFDAYVILFYLAFFERNIEKVRGELISVFNVDTFRRLLVECLIPMALKRLGGEGKKTWSKRKEV